MRFGQHDVYLNVAGGLRLAEPAADLAVAAALVSSRAGVASALRTMRDLGWIKTERRRITVLDLDWRPMFWPSREEGRKWVREALRFDGQWVDCHVMGILSREWFR